MSLDGRSIVFAASFASAAACSALPKKGDDAGEEKGGGRIESSDMGLLVMTKTAGFRHGSIPSAVKAINRIAADHAWSVTVTEDPSLFTNETLDDYDLIVLLNTTGDIFEIAQQTAIENFIEAGGGLVGVHSATDTESDWPWLRTAFGAHFRDHPSVQSATIVVEDETHPATAHLSPRWSRSDEWYNFDRNPRTEVHVLLSLDETSYSGGTMDDHPIAWTNEVGRGRLFYTALGHTEESYSEPAFLSHLEGGLRWVARQE